MKPNQVLYFQELISQLQNPNNVDRTLQDSSIEDPADIDPADIFFQLANVPTAGFKIDHTDKAVLIHQDTSAQSHTGGIVWEASYLLASYLLHLYKDSNNLKPLGKLIEVGSGCGMLGLVLAASNLCEYAVLTETTTVLDNLSRNVFENIQQGVVSSHQICTQTLRWEHYKEDIATKKEILTPHSFDTIVGTDVIFSIIFVKPLLKTLRKLSHMKSLILLCVPIRCEDAYALFLQKAPLYDLNCTDVTMELNDICPWGATLECKLLRLSKIKDPSIRSTSDHVAKKRRRER